MITSACTLPPDVYFSADIFVHPNTYYYYRGFFSTAAFNASSHDRPPNQDPMVILEKSRREKLFVKNMIERLDTREYANLR